MNDDSGRLTLVRGSANTEDSVVLVVMEHEAAWPDCVDECRRLTPNTVVVSQHDDEPLFQFVRRVERKIAGLGSENRQVSAAVLSVSGRAGGPSADARHSVALAMLATVSGRQLWLVADNEANEPIRHELIELAGSLNAFAGGRRGTEIGVRFSQASTLVRRRRADHDSVTSERDVS